MDNIPPHLACPPEHGRCKPFVSFSISQSTLIIWPSPYDLFRRWRTMRNHSVSGQLDGTLVRRGVVDPPTTTACPPPLPPILAPSPCSLLCPPPPAAATARALLHHAPATCRGRPVLPVLPSSLPVHAVSRAHAFPPRTRADCTRAAVVLPVVAVTALATGTTRCCHYKATTAFAPRLLLPYCAFLLFPRMTLRAHRRSSYASNTAPRLSTSRGAQPLQHGASRMRICALP